MLVVGLDVGTTGCKACVFSRDGSVKGYGFAEYDVVCDEPGKGEQDSENVWRLTRQVIRQAVSQCGAAADIKALSLSVQGDAIIPVTKDFEPVYPAVLGMDYRSHRQAGWCAEKFGERALFDRTGMRPHPMNSAIKMLWLKQERPEAYRSAKRIVTYADYIAGRLTGEAVIDYTMASRTMCFDLATRQWATDLLGSLDIDPGLLSDPRPSGSEVGALRRTLATELGLPQGVLVVTGGHDQACAALGAGVVAEGRAAVSTGTAEVLSACFAQARLSDTMYESYYPVYHHTVPDRYFTFALLHVGGIVFKWYRDNLGLADVATAAKEGHDPYDAITSQMPDTPSPVMFVPHLNGSGTPMCDMDAKGAIVGLTMATTRHDIAKAVLEGLCFELRHNLDTMSAAGIRVEELVAVGGGAKSRTWLQLKADILGRPIQTLKVREAACLGAGLLAGTAAGIYSDLGVAVAQTVAASDQYSPRADMTTQYDQRFKVYQQIYPALTDLNRCI